MTARLLGNLVLAISCTALLAGPWAHAQEAADTTKTPAPADAPKTAAPADTAAKPAAPAEVHPDAVKYEKAKVVVNGEAEANGIIQLIFSVEGGKATLLPVDVLKKTNKNDIAKAIYTQLAIAAGDNYKVKVSGQEVKIERAKKEFPMFTLTVDKLEVGGVSVLVKKG